MPAPKALPSPGIHQTVRILFLTLNHGTGHGPMRIPSRPLPSFRSTRMLDVLTRTGTALKPESKKKKRKEINEMSCGVLAGRGLQLGKTLGKKILGQIAGADYGAKCGRLVCGLFEDIISESNTFQFKYECAEI